MKQLIAFLSIFALVATFPFQALAVSIPGGPALFETALASRISATDTSMSLLSNSLRGGESISGYHCFTIDEGRSDSEYVCGVISGTTVTGLVRGISFSTATSTVSSLKTSHRVGANVKITDFPLLQRLSNVANGIEGFPNTLSYTDHPTFSSTTQLVDKKYVDDTAFSGAGVIDANSTSRGVVELATACEAASSTSQGGAGVLAIPASLATSTYNSATANCKVVATGNGGTIDQAFLPSTISKNITLSGTVSITGTAGGSNGNNGNKAYLNVSPTATAAAGTTTVFSQTITANTLSTANYYVTTLYINGFKTTSGVCNGDLYVGYGGATTTVFNSQSGAAPSRSGFGTVRIILAANGATNSQKLYSTFMTTPTTTLPIASTTVASSNMAIDSTQNQNLIFNFVGGNAGNCWIDPALVTSEFYN